MEAYDMGYAAYKTGEKNPYDDITEPLEFTEWVSGWYDADYDALMK